MRLSPSDWAKAGLDAFADVGLAGVAIDPLARRLGATKGSFYWHFASRDELILATLELWEERDTAEVIAVIEAIPDPRERLVALARHAYGRAASGSDAQAGVLAAASDPRVRPVLERVTAARLAFLESLYASLGLETAVARRHARLAYAIYVGIADLRRAAPAALGSADDAEEDLELMIATLTQGAGLGGPWAARRRSRRPRGS